MRKDMILWLEDQPDSIWDELDYCRDQGWNVELTATCHKFYDLLLGECDRIFLIIMDVMLPAVPNLESIGVPDSGTENGFRAGLRMLEWLRGIKGGQTNWRLMKIPVLLLSWRELDDVDDQSFRRIRDHNVLSAKAFVEHLAKDAGLDKDRASFDEQFRRIVQRAYKEQND